MPSAANNPDRFKATRAAHASELAEDYVEAIADLIERNGTARVTRLAQELGVSHVTVNRTLGRLERDGLVVTEPYQPVTLTSKGRALAKASKTRHRIVVEFLLAAGVSSKQAQLDAEGIEHHCSKQTLKALERLTQSLG